MNPSFYTHFPICTLKIFSYIIQQNNTEHNNSITMEIGDINTSSSSSSNNNNNNTYSNGGNSNRIEWIRKGQIVDVRDKSGVWREGRVMEIFDGDAVIIHYLYTSSAYDDRIDFQPLSSSSSSTLQQQQQMRIQPHGTRAYTDSPYARLMPMQKVDVYDEDIGQYVEGDVIRVMADRVFVRLYNDINNVIDDEVNESKLDGRAGERSVWMPHDPSLFRPFGKETHRGEHECLDYHTSIVDAAEMVIEDDDMDHYSSAASQPKRHREYNNNQDLYIGSSSSSSSAIAGIEQKQSTNDEDDLPIQSKNATSASKVTGTRKVNDIAKITRYIAALTLKGLRVVSMEGDGNCLFRSVAYQVYGDQSLHRVVRTKCVEYMLAERAYFEPFTVQNINANNNSSRNVDFFQLYMQHKQRDGVWGDDMDIQAICELYDRPAEIYAYDHHQGARMLKTFHEDNDQNQQQQQQTDASSATVSASTPTREPKEPIRLSYYGGGHFDAIVKANQRPFTIEEAGKIESERINMVKEKDEKEHLQMLRIKYVTGTDIESALSESLKIAEEEEKKMIEKTIETSYVEHVDPEAKSAIHVSDVAATEQAAVEEALRLSKQGMEIDHDHSPIIIPSDIGEDQQLEWAIMQSMHESGNANEQSSASSSSSSSSAIGATTIQKEKSSVEDRVNNNSNDGNDVVKDNAINNTMESNLIGDEDDEEKLLQMAILQSLEKE